MAKYLHAVLIDLSGTLHIGDELISNSKHALQKLRSSNIPYRYVTNTTKESKRSLVNRLRNLGLDIDTNEVYTSLTAAEKYVSSKQLRPHLMLTADALNDFDHLAMDEPNAVVIGLAPDKFQYENMNLAFQYLLRGAELIAIHKARYYKRENGLALGPGPFVNALEYATNTKATVIGKPEKEFFLSAIRDLNCSDEASIYMIGDDVRDDIDGSQKAGLKGILVRTGKYRLGDENKIHPLPHKVANNFPEAVEYILDVTGKQL